MKPTLQEIADASDLACVAIYDPISPGIFNQVFRVGETTCGVKLVQRRLHVVTQGTENMPGWMADADILPVHHPHLGHLHEGFWRNIPELQRQLEAYIASLGIEDLELAPCGHSKGAGEADHLAGSLLVAGHKVFGPLLFAGPNAGFSDHAEFMQINLQDGMNFRNADQFDIGDPVPLVPLPPYVPTYHRTHVEAPPPGWDRLNLKDWHNGKLYQAAAHYALQTLAPPQIGSGG